VYICKHQTKPVCTATRCTQRARLALKSKVFNAQCVCWSTPKCLTWIGKHLHGVKGGSPWHALSRPWLEAVSYQCYQYLHGIKDPSFNDQLVYYDLNIANNTQRPHYIDMFARNESSAYNRQYHAALHIQDNAPLPWPEIPKHINRSSSMGPTQNTMATMHFTSMRTLGHNAMNFKELWMTDS
jgi:hypothetical protein